MKIFYLIAVLALTAVTSSYPVEDDHENGVNGWYVPQADGSFVWMSIEEGETLLEQLELEEEMEEEEQINGRLTLTTVPVTYYLYTSANPTSPTKITETAKSILNSNFDASNPTRFVIHGWTQSYKADMNTNIRDAWLSRGDYNIIIVDWARARSIDYASSVVAVSSTGKKLASMIDYLVQNHNMDLETTEVIGHSLGAHVAGYAGKNVGTGMIQTIVGLDPALPLFSYKKTKKRLCSDDANYVETIHTNGGLLGFLEPIGKGSFYPNGGKSQPGCTLDITGSCSHARSHIYYAEAVESNNYPSIRCEDYKSAVANSCGSSYSGVKMAGATNAYVVTGEYYVPVYETAPYGYGS